MASLSGGDGAAAAAGAVVVNASAVRCMQGKYSGLEVGPMGEHGDVYLRRRTAEVNGAGACFAPFSLAISGALFPSDGRE